MKDQLYSWLSRYLPRRLVYHCAIRVISEATTGRWSSTIVPELPAMEALRRFEPSELGKPWAGRA